MLDPKLIKENPEIIRNMLKSRAVEFDLDELISSAARMKGKLKRRWPLNEAQICVKKNQKPKQNTIALLLHKPPGYVTTRDDELSRPTVFDLLPPDLGYLFPAGRLDFESEGLLLFSNDSLITNLLTDPSHKIDKTYLVTIRGQLTPESLHLRPLRSYTTPPPLLYSFRRLHH